MNDQDFYIGYLPQAPPSYARIMRLFVGLLLLLLPVLAYLIVSRQAGFPSSTFEYGLYQTLNGELIKSPVPMIRIRNGTDFFGRPRFKSVLLVGFGKHGAAGTIRQMEEQTGENLENRTVELKGTLIYYNGFTLLELTEGKQALVNHSPVPQPFNVAMENLNGATLQGEIIDPKCYFGVMKPGEGKPHRSCAVRCISGGIPPMLEVVNNKGEQQYFLLVGSEREPVNDQVLDFVAEPVVISGQIERLEDLYLLKMASLKRLGT